MYTREVKQSWSRDDHGVGGGLCGQEGIGRVMGSVIEEFTLELLGTPCMFYVCLSIWSLFF